MTIPLLQPEEQVLSTLNKDGSRNWLRPRVSPGRFLKARTWAGYALILLFVALPNIYINSKPAILLDLAARRFTFFGTTLLPQDTLLLALFMVFIIVSIFLVTALWGRVWCGWACPQTVYMELVYRPIERFFDGPPGFHGAPGKKATPLRTALKYLLYFVLSAFLANVFLSYFVGVERLSQWVQGSPFNHPAAFALMAATTGLMMFNFSYFREQTCIVACPYGRLQSVLVDRNSLIISYDDKRGEPRGKLVKNPAPDAPPRGDCIDCDMCVDTCPTGIDIRKGLQLECVACAQCIDACDAVMDKIGKPRGLVRYSSQAAMGGERQHLLRARTVVYPTIMLVLAGAFVAVSQMKSTASVTVLRGLGNPFTVDAAGAVTNQLRLKVLNRTDDSLPFSVALAPDTRGQLVINENPLAVSGGAARTESMLIVMPRSEFKNGHRDITLSVSSGDWSTQVQYRLLGPE